MYGYEHERRKERDQAAHENQTWPLMSTNGVDLDDCKLYLKDRGLSWELAEENGWYPSRKANDCFLRIVIPAVSTKSSHVYWQARAVSSNVHLRYQSPKGPRHGAIISVRAFPNDEPTPFCIVAEGPMDALAVAECGYDSFAIMGMNPGLPALLHLAKLIARRATLVVLDKEPEATAQGIVLAHWLCTQSILAKYNIFRKEKDLAAGTKQDRLEFVKSALWWKP